MRPPPAPQRGAAHGGMPDGSVARARRRGFRAAHPAYGRTARSGRPLGARGRGARADTRRASGSRCTSPSFGPSPPGGSVSAPSPNGYVQPSSRTWNDARPASGATPRYSIASRASARRSISSCPTTIAPGHPLLVRRRVAETRPVSARRAALTKVPPKSPWRRRMLLRPSRAPAGQVAQWRPRLFWARLSAVIAAFAAGRPKR